MAASPWWRRWKGWSSLSLALLNGAFAIVNAARGHRFTDQAGLAITFTVVAVFAFLRPWAWRRR